MGRMEGMGRLIVFFPPYRLRVMPFYLALKYITGRREEEKDREGSLWLNIYGVCN